MTKKQKKMLWRILVSAALLAAAALLDLEGPVRLCAFLLPYAVIGYDVLWRAARNIAHGQVFDENFLMALATIGAFFTGGVAGIMGNALGGRIGAMVSGFVYGLELILFSGFTYSLFNHFAAVGAEGTGHDCIDAMALMTIMKNPVVGIIIIVGAFILASVLAVRYQKKVAEKSQAA